MTKKIIADMQDEEIDLTTEDYEIPSDDESAQIIRENNALLDIKALVSPDGKKIVAFRFYLKFGAYDIRTDIAKLYNISFNCTNGVKLYEVKGILATKSELQNHLLIPDVSTCKQDIETLKILVKQRKAS